jgi:hypothetical protein
MPNILHAINLPPAPLTANDDARATDLAAVRAGSDAVIPRLDELDLSDCDHRTVAVLLASVNEALGMKPRRYTESEPSPLVLVRRWLLETHDAIVTRNAR